MNNVDLPRLIGPAETSSGPDRYYKVGAPFATFLFKYRLLGQCKLPLFIQEMLTVR
jgi:hypothetical protein